MEFVVKLNLFQKPHSLRLYLHKFFLDFLSFLSLYPKTASLIALFANLYGLKTIRDPLEVSNTQKQKILTKLMKIKSQIEASKKIRL